ncbi:MAG: HEAT repeat domain-containing protein [Spirochaetota bacterium]|nr:HEAT repeat domain-containing protein [Spirochaetota bacterium]
MMKILKTRIIAGIFLYLLIAPASHWSGEEETREDAVARYISYLSGHSVQLKRIAVRKLGGYKDSRSVSPLIRALGDSDYEVRFYARKALGELGNLALRKVIMSLKTGKAIVRKGCAGVLGDMGLEDSIPALKESLSHDRDGEVRSAAADSLGRIGHEDGVDVLVQAMKDKKWRVRSSSARALGLIGGSRAVETLIQGLKDSNSYVRVHSAGALGKIKDRKAVPQLIRLLKDGNPEARETAAWALGKIADKRAVKPLLNSLLKDGSPNVRKEAREALKRLGYSSQDIDEIQNR